jgi:tRNA A37 methylthiotransferase MiaB
MPDQVSASVKAERRRCLTDIESQLRQEYFEQLVGQTLRVLVETSVDERTNRCAGTSCRYAPVELPGNSHMSGQLISCVPRAVFEHRLHA